jgi:hypothetical protein
VVGIEPPYVATDLLNWASDPRAMPLDKFIVEVMVILKTQPAVVEICVENVKRSASLPRTVTMIPSSEASTRQWQTPPTRFAHHQKPSNSWVCSCARLPRDIQGAPSYVVV